MEFIQPADSFPSFWSELLDSEGPLIHHFGVAVEPATAFESTRSGFAAAGFPTVQMGMGSWGCYAYIGAWGSTCLRDAVFMCVIRWACHVLHVCCTKLGRILGRTSTPLSVNAASQVQSYGKHALIADARATLGGVLELLGNGISCEAPGPH